MSIDKIKQLVGSMAKTVEENEKLATPFLVAKLATAKEVYPHDQTIGLVHRVLEKMADNNKIFITRQSFRDLYNKHFLVNTKFASIFGDELGNVEPLATPTMAPVMEIDPVKDYEGDAILNNALASAFNNEKIRLYSNDVAKKALNKIADSLDMLNLNPSSLIVEDGSDKFIIARADYETPKGKTSIYVPVEVTEGKISEANCFVGNKGPEDLTYSAVKGYVTSLAGRKLAMNGSQILDVLTKAASEDRTVSSAEMALIRLNASRQQQSDFFADQITGQDIYNEGQKEVELPRSNQTTNFEEKFASVSGFAEFMFSDTTVKSARDAIIKDLRSFGYSNPQVKVIASDNKSINYGVTLQGTKVSFKVPVKVINKVASHPTIILCEGSVLPFTEKSILDLQVTNKTDSKVAAATSNQSELGAPEIIQNIKDALSEENYAKAEDALNVLANRNDTVAYATGFDVYMQGITGQNVKTASHKCDRIVKNSSSKYELCGHTILPLHKVYTDAQGNCRPTYRQGMDDNFEGAIFMNAKIFG